jgi:hypothetical protein
MRSSSRCVKILAADIKKFSSHTLENNFGGNFFTAKIFLHASEKNFFDRENFSPHRRKKNFPFSRKHKIEITFQKNFDE